MEFRIADTFLDSLSRLTDQEQKTVKTTVFDLQVNPANPGMQFHKLDRVKDPNFWSVRVNQDVRLIVHKTRDSLLACYVNHHEQAYHWAEQRKLETHPTTGAMQIVQIREEVKIITIPKYEEVAQPKPRLFGHLADEQLLRYGVPPEWLPDVRDANEDSLLEIADHLPSEAAEALLNLATGTTPPPLPSIAHADPFNHPDALRRFRVMRDVAELERALESPWEKWTVFLHPAQRQFVEQDLNGPTRISGSAGTGKTIVALHRAAFLARRYPDARVLLATFSEPLANALRLKLRGLIGNEPRLAERLEVHSLNALGLRLYALNLGQPQMVSRTDLQTLLNDAARQVAGHKFAPHFLRMEWEQTVDAWQLTTWEVYRDVKRLGRKTRLSEAQRRILWDIFSRVQAELARRSLLTDAMVFTRLAAHIAATRQPPFDAAVIDEAQDLNLPQLRFLAALASERPNSLFFTGDLGQRIFQTPFSWSAVGLDMRGRCRTLRINYRTSHQIRQQADRLLDPQISDVDGNPDDRRGTISVFNGPPPGIKICNTADDERQTVAHWLAERLRDGCQPDEIGVFVRSADEIERARATVEMAGIPFTVLDERIAITSGQVSVSTMHLAKGLEFRAVAVLACDDAVIPSAARIAAVADDSDLEEVYNTERNLLYVACTRARDHLLVTGVAPASEFLEDLAFRFSP